MEINKETFDKLEKIKRLMDNAGTLGEAQAAALAFQRLLKKEGLTEADVFSHLKDAGDVQVEPGESIPFKSKPMYVSLLAKVISENFRCRCFWNITNKKWKRCGDPCDVITFVGDASDVEIAVQVFNITHKAMIRLYKKWVKGEKERDYSLGYGEWSLSHGRAMKQSYMIGFVNGLADAYDEQKKNDQELAMVLVIHPQVDKYVEENYRLGVLVPKTKLGINESAERAGYAAGNSFGAGDRLE